MSQAILTVGSPFFSYFIETKVGELRRVSIFLLGHGR
jgi:hypothetical protein